MTTLANWRGCGFAQFGDAKEEGMRAGVFTWDRVTRKAIVMSKGVIERCLQGRHNPESLVFIVGCQRSGTSLMAEIFERDFRSKVYGEFSELSSNDPKGLRFNELYSVKETIKQVGMRLVVMKPLVESQHLNRLLDYFDSSKAIWMYRHYKDVVSSNLKKFGMDNGVKDIRPMVYNSSDNWRSENVSEHTREVLARYFSESMSPYDAAALFWYARNRLFVELDLESDLRVAICKYEDLVTKPQEKVKEMYGFIELDYPGAWVLPAVHASSVGKGKSVPLSPEIEELCDDLYCQLEKTYEL